MSAVSLPDKRRLYRILNECLNECHSEVTGKVTKACCQQSCDMANLSDEGPGLFNHQQLLFFKQQTTNLSKSHVCLTSEWNELFESWVSMFKRAITNFTGVMMEINLCWKEEYVALACFMKIPTKKSVRAILSDLSSPSLHFLLNTL